MTARVIGYFVNQTVVRADFTENPRFIDLLNDVQKSIDEGASHAWYPFALIVQGLQPTRDLSRSPLIQAAFSWQQAPRLIPREKAGPLVLGQADQAVKLDGLVIAIEYATDLFDTATIDRMAKCYCIMLKSITAGPKQRVDDLTILPGTDWNQLVEEWNTTEAPFPDQACLHQLFEQQVERTPETVAIASGEAQLTYLQLNQRANQLAHFLQEQGVGPDRLVGVFLEPSLQMVIQNTSLG